MPVTVIGVGEQHAPAVAQDPVELAKHLHAVGKMVHRVKRDQRAGCAM
jgi:hypothetical protein